MGWNVSQSDWLEDPPAGAKKDPLDPVDERACEAVKAGLGSAWAEGEAGAEDAEEQEPQATSVEAAEAPASPADDSQPADGEPLEEPSQPDARTDLPPPAPDYGVVQPVSEPSPPVAEFGLPPEPPEPDVGAESKPPPAPESKPPPAPESKPPPAPESKPPPPPPAATSEPPPPAPESKPPPPPPAATSEPPPPPPREPPPPPPREAPSPAALEAGVPKPIVDTTPPQEALADPERSASRATPPPPPPPGRAGAGVQLEVQLRSGARDSEGRAELEVELRPPATPTPVNDDITPPSPPIALPEEMDEPAGASAHTEARASASASGQFVVPDDARDAASASGEFVVPRDLREVEVTRGEILVDPGPRQTAATSGEFVVPEEVAEIEVTSGELVVEAEPGQTAATRSELAAPEEVPEIEVTSGEIMVEEEPRQTAATSGEFMVKEREDQAEKAPVRGLEIVPAPAEGSAEPGAAADSTDEEDSDLGVQAERSGEFEADGREAAAQSGEFEAVDEAELASRQTDEGVPSGVTVETTPRLFIPSLTRPAGGEPSPEAEDGVSEASEGAAVLLPVREDAADGAAPAGEAPPVEEAAAIAPVREDTSEPPEMLEAEDLVEDDGEPDVAAKAQPPARPAADEEAPAPPKPPPAAVKRPRKHWCDEVFSEHYTALRRPDAEEAARRDIDFFVESTELEPGATVLDVGCGDGAHCFALASRGFVATGVDNSLSQLLAASQRNEASGSGVMFLHGDMRQLPVDGPYDAVICLGTTFGYFEEEQNRQTLEHMKERLKPDGRLLLQVFNRDHLVSRLPVRTWWEGERCLVLDEAEMNYFANRLRVHRTIVFNDGRQFEHYMFLRAFTLHDIGKLCSTAGLRVLEVSGSRETRGHFFGATSPDLWILAGRKPDD